MQGNGAVAALALCGLLASLSACAAPSRANAAARGAQDADVFPAIPEVSAVHGIVRVTLDVVLDPVSGYPAFSWNAHLGEAPTIRVRPGERIEMTVRNAMRPFQGRRDDVSIHFHGMTVSPNAPGDDSIMTLAAYGQTLHYRVDVPRDHEPGLYWYHPHAHGETYYDVTNGMAGAIVVEGMQRHLPALARMRERIVVLRDVATGPGFRDDDMPRTGTNAGTIRARIVRPGPGKPCGPERGLQPTLNRQSAAHIALRPGERQFFRVVNASAARYFDLSVDGAPLDLVALDGVPLDAYPGTPAVRRVGHVLVPPAGRAEFVVTGPSRPSVLRSACVDTGPAGDANPAAVLAAFVGAPAAAVPAGRPLRTGGRLPANVLSRPFGRPAAHRTIRFTEDDRGFYLGGKAYAMDDPPSIVARSGTVEEWTLENATAEAHVFHIHQVHFVTEAVGGAPVAPREWADTVDVPPRAPRRGGGWMPGRVRVLIDFRDPVVRGTFLYHCHILDHEDRGMMAKIEVI